MSDVNICIERLENGTLFIWYRSFRVQSGRPRSKVTETWLGK